MKKKYLIPIIVAFIGGLFTLVAAYMNSAGNIATIEDNNISNSHIEVNQ